jgi:predicted nucleic acid-binding OB-fold protein
MIEIKPPEEAKETIEGFDVSQQKFVLTTEPASVEFFNNDKKIADELHELNKTLKEILREMRKRKV